MSYPPPPGTPEENNPYAPQPDPYAPQTPAPPPPAYPQPYGQYAAPTPAGGNNGLAIGAMVTGIASIILACCCWPIGLIAGAAGIAMGFISQNQIRERGQTNRGMAVAGLATGAAGVVLAIVNIILTFAMNLHYFNFSNFN